MKTNVYVQTSDKSIHLIKIFQYLFNKHWGNDYQVYILGYKQPEFKLLSNFNFVSLGKDIGPNLTTGLIDYFTSIPDKYIIYTCDDVMPIHPINRLLLHKSEKLIRTEPNIGRIGLTPDLSKKTYDVISLEEEYDLIKLKQNSKYRLSTTWSIWDKSYFLRYMSPNSNLWEFESQTKSNNDGVDIIGTRRQYVLDPNQMYKQGKLLKYWYKSDWRTLPDMSLEDQNYVKTIMDMH